MTNKKNQILDNLERVIISSCMEREDFLRELLDRDFIGKDFSNTVCRGLFEIMKAFYLKDFIVPSALVVKQKFIVIACKGKYDDENKISVLYKQLNVMLQNKEDDIESFKKHLDLFKKFKDDRLMTNILEEAHCVLLKRNPDFAFDYILEQYIKNFSSKKADKAIRYNELMRQNIEKFDPFIKEEDKEISQAAPTGVLELDTTYLHGGVQPGNYMVIAGRPGSGKTALLKYIAKHNAQVGKKVLFVSLEMSREQLKQGYYAQTARVDYGKILEKNLNADEYDRMVESINNPENDLENFFILDRDTMTVTDFVSTVIKFKKEYNIDVVCLDYLQLLKMPDGSTPLSSDDFSSISEYVRLIIKKLGIVGYILAQVNRACESRPDKHPLLADLRSCGTIEQDAAYVATTYRDELYDKNTKEPNIMDIKVVKCRFGVLGIIKVVFEGKYQNIGNLPTKQVA